MTSVSHRALLILCAAALAACSGCHRPATFEAEAALRTGAIYTGPAIATFSMPVDRLTIGQIAKELRAMANADHALAGAAELNPDPAHADRLRTIDTAHTTRLSQILDVIGWPTENVVGQDAALAAFVLAQQATHDPEFQKRCIALMHDRMASQEINPERLAMLTDRVRIHAGLGQLYGTQVRLTRNEHGVLIATASATIDDLDTLDDRRTLLGLAPWRHYCRKVADTAERAQTPRFGRSN